MSFNFLENCSKLQKIQNQQKLHTKKSANDIQQGEFADLVKNAIKEAVRIGERSENLSIRGISDKADVSKVVTAVSEAELTLQTVVTVRDKVLEAYKEIMRMPM